MLKVGQKEEPCINLPPLVVAQPAPHPPTIVELAAGLPAPVLDKGEHGLWGRILALLGKLRVTLLGLGRHRCAPIVDEIGQPLANLNEDVSH